MYITEKNKLHVSKKMKKQKCIKKQNMIGLLDQNMATNPQCYKDREDYSRRSSSQLCGMYGQMVGFQEALQQSCQMYKMLKSLFFYTKINELG